jgi:hypothetical protein
LKVRLAPGRGGRSGAHYEIAVGSLPADIQMALKAAEWPVEALPNPSQKAADEWKRRLNLIMPIVQHPPGSAERRNALQAILATRHIGPDGRPLRLTETTLRRWIKAYDDDLAGLRPKARVDKGSRRIVIADAAERAIPFDFETWQRIAAELRTYIRGHWKENVTLKLIRGRANIRFRELITAAGFDHCHTLPESTFNVPRAFVEAERRYSNVAILRKDRKTYDDTQRFRIPRSRAGMLPVDWVVGDVHPLDIVMHRDDGSAAHARMIAWLDVATNRMFFDLVLCEAGTGIRNAHLIQSFLRMVAAWGMPRNLYIDNGREYRFADALDDSPACGSSAATLPWSDRRAWARLFRCGTTPPTRQRPTC